VSETTVSELPQVWEQVGLTEIAQINPALDRCIVSDSVEVNFVPMRAVEPEGGGLLRPEKRPYGEVKKGYTAFLSGDVIMAKITPCMENGKTTVVPVLPDSVCFGSTEFHVIRAEAGVESRWVANFLLQHETRRSAQRQMTGGVGQMRVPATFLESVRLPLPPIAEQQRIVDKIDELFSDLDAAVALLGRVQEKLKLYRASVLKAAVEGTLTVEWRAQHLHTQPASELLKRILVERRRHWEEDQLAKFKAKGHEPPKNWKAKYKDPAVPNTADLPRLPKGWCWITFDQVIWSLRSGSAETSGRQETDFPILKSSAVRHGTIDHSDLNYLQASQSIHPENFLRPGDFMVTRLSGSVDYVGCSAIVKGEACTGIQYPDRLFCSKLVAGVEGTYVSYCFQHYRIRKTIEKAAKSTAGHQRISMSDLRPLVFALPSPDEQQAIVEAVEDQLSVIDHLEAELNAKLQSAQSLRQAILRHAFSGKLVPQDPNDEPASKLLKRIASERKARQHKPAATKYAAKNSNGSRPARRGRTKKNKETNGCFPNW